MRTPDSLRSDRLGCATIDVLNPGTDTVLWLISHEYDAAPIWKPGTGVMCDVILGQNLVGSLSNRQQNKLRNSLRTTAERCNRQYPPAVRGDRAAIAFTEPDGWRAIDLPQENFIVRTCG